MKRLCKILPVLFFALLATVTVKAQDVNFGVRGSASLVNFYGDDADDAKTKMGYQLGAFAEFKLSDAFAIQPELVFSKEGSKDDKADLPWNLSYINVPVMAKVYVTEGLNLQAGPQIGFLVGANVDGESKLGDVEVKDSFKSTNFSMNIGAGYDITEKIGVDLRYNFGLTKVGEEPEQGDAADTKSSNILLGVSFKF
ncbi:hypothetical protein FUAX_29970 [Fulvitalea axinellae]|uniref:Outer membrane protein beta-barrel domain-containing protein n=1 Tax=Fulvitalea axinellae TaxID=1182444 RepID=A0AAU9CMI5_9BACT|nr:hypothetical protein FUAX_29970 [Fulvitalea axinellae]